MTLLVTQHTFSAEMLIIDLKPTNTTNNCYQCKDTMIIEISVVFENRDSQLMNIFQCLPKINLIYYSIGNSFMHACCYVGVR